MASTAGADSAGEGSDVACFGSLGAVQTLTRTVNPSAVMALRRELKAFDPDVVHVRAFLTQLSPAILPLLADRPALMHAVMYDAVCPTGKKLWPDGRVCRQRAGWVCKEHCLSWPAFGVLMGQRRLYRRWRDAFDLVVTNSRATAEKLEAEGIGPCRVVWNAVDPAPRRPPLGEVPRASLVARLSREKGVDVALRAMARVREAVPDAQLQVIGDGPLRGELEALTTQLELQDAVTFTGRLPRERAQAEAGSAWVQLVPSVWDEPFGLVAAEAMMRGTAVIASGSGGLAEIVEPGRTGYLHSPGDDAALAEHLRRVLTDRRHAETLGAGARQRALHHFAMDRCLDEFEDIYADLLARPGARRPQTPAPTGAAP